MAELHDAVLPMLQKIQESISAGFRAVNEEMAAGFRASDARFNDLDDRLNRLEREIKGHGRGLADVAEDTHMLVKQIRATQGEDRKTVSERLDEIERRLKDVEQRTTT